MAYEQFLRVVGLLTTAYIGLQFSSFFWLYLRPSSILRYLHDSNGTREANWALVTGASDGIGRAFAGELCRLGFHVVLHGRNPAKLKGVQDELKRKYPRSQTRLVISDANLSSPTILTEQILAKVDDLKLSVLINNVGGMGGLQPKDEFLTTLDEQPVATVDGLININARFSTHITKLLLPVLRKRPRSLIMNISSAAQVGMPWLAVYSATKAYITSWSKALTLEMHAEKRKVEVLNIVVGTVHTNASVAEAADLFNPTPETFVRATLGRVGCGKASVSGYFPHALQVAFLDLLPEPAARPILIKGMSWMKAQSKRR